MKKFNTLLVLSISLTLSACNLSSDDPKTVADKYWQYLQSGNISEAQKLTATRNQQALLQHSNHITANSQLQNEEAKTIVSTTITTLNPGTNYTHTQSFDTVLVLRDGQWKVDVEQTQIPPPPSARKEELQQLADELSESMHENMESMDDAVEQGMEMLNEALQEGSKEMGDSLLQLMNELNSSMHEAVEKMKERRQQQMQQQQDKPQTPQQAPQPDPSKCEGMI
jgi:hypothetical protein